MLRRLPLGSAHSPTSRVLPCRLRRSEEAAKSSVWHMSELGWQVHRSCTSGAHTVRTMRTTVYTVHAHPGLTARHVIHRRAAGRLGDQMSSPDDNLPVRVGPAFGIAPCGELWAKEFGGGADVRAASAYKMASYTPILLKKLAVRPRPSPPFRRNLNSYIHESKFLLKLGYSRHLQRTEHRTGEYNSHNFPR